MESRPLQPALGRMDRTGGVTLHPLPSTGARWPESLTAGPDGAIWFLDPPARTVGRMAPDGTLTEFPFAQPNTAARGTMTARLASGSNALWFTEPRASPLGVARIHRSLEVRCIESRLVTPGGRRTGRGRPEMARSVHGSIFWRSRYSGA